MKSTEIQNESTSVVSEVGNKFAGCCLNAYERREVRQLRSHVVLPNEKFRLKYLCRNRVQFSYKAKETLLLLIFSSSDCRLMYFYPFIDISSNHKFYSMILSQIYFSLKIQVRRRPFAVLRLNDETGKRPS